MAVGPLGAPNPGPVPEPSPYCPSTRRFGSPLHLRIEEVPGAERLGDELSELSLAGRALNAERRIDRTMVAALKMRALERIWAAATDRAKFDAWRAERGVPLQRWATFVVLTERLGAGWQRWPEQYRDPAGSAVAHAAGEQPHRVAFHAWIQWCFDLQLAAASAPLFRVADMPVGVDPGGFDAWDWQGQLAMGASVGAPPDRFNAAGQDWGLPPFVPHRLRQAAYRPFIETIHAQLRHAGGLRIDHVLGLFRLWWIPSGLDPSRGAYVRSHTDELLEIVALESHRAGALVVGEDLGTVPPGVRDELRRRRLLSTRLALFERVEPARYPERAFAGVTTHDLPTVAGTWSGTDLDDQVASRLTPDRAALALLRSRLARAAEVTPDATLDELVERLHRRLANAPPMMIAATLEDALRVEERPNMPGTVPPQRDNWSLALPVPIEELGDDGRVRSTVEALRR
jgi:4-alpha-glucanotransferase